MNAFVFSRWLFLSSLVAVVAAPAGSVLSQDSRARISEVYYHPPAPDGDRLEFLEVRNTSGAALQLDGWRLEKAVEFTFAPGTQIEAGESLVVARDRDAFLRELSVPPSRVVGDYEGALDNAGEKVRLVDAFDAVVDAFTFDDARPWAESADGGGGSLQRTCLEASGDNSRNWHSGPPTPAAPSPFEGCPPVAGATPVVQMSEIFYHPPNEERGRPAGEAPEPTEFVEIHNLTDREVSLAGWSFDDGIDFDFPIGASIAPRGHLVICADVSAFLARFPAAASDGTAFVGPFEGRLANGGERLTLVDDAGQVVDSVHYRDRGDWHYGADGRGRSLERVHFGEVSDDPSLWTAASPPQGTYVEQVITGFPGPGLLSRDSGTVLFALSLDGEGEVLVDDLSVTRVGASDIELLDNGAFDEDLSFWSLVGKTGDSEWAGGEGVDGTGALRLTSSGPCSMDGCGKFDAVVQAVPGIFRNGRYRISMKVRAVSGNFRVRAGFVLQTFRTLTEGTVVIAVAASPGHASSAAGTGQAPPRISDIGRFPQQPNSTEPVWITARVRGAETVQLRWDLDELGGVLDMTDDGHELDGEAGDGVYGVEMPVLPNLGQVRFRITARSGEQSVGFPATLDTGSPLPWEYRGYFIFDGEPGLPESTLPVYHLLIDNPAVDANDFSSVNRALVCDELRWGAFAFEGELYPAVGLRFRGNTACLINKRNFKIRFPKNRFFRDLEKVNLNGLWTDKALVREHLAWELIDELGVPSMHTEYERVHVNGGYYGLFLCLEHPDERFLERVGLDDDGMLYKAKQPSNINDDDLAGLPLLPPGTYHEGWEEETQNGGDFSDIEAFVEALHAGGFAGPGLAFFRDRVFEDMIIEYHLGQVVLNSFDSAVKNHFLYRDPDTERWGLIPWDQDLVMGKFFTRDAVGPGRQVGTLNDIMLSDIGWDLNPWVMTTINGNERFNWLLDFFFRAEGGYYQRAYLVRLWDVLEEKYRNDVYDARIDALVARLESEIELDFDFWGRYPSNVFGYPDELRPNIAIIKEQINLHRSFLIRYLNQFHAEIADHDRLKITELMYFPEDDAGELEFIELRNTTGRQIDVSNWSIDGVDFTFPAGSIVPSGGQVVVARSPSAFRDRYGDRELLDLYGPYTGRLENSGETLRVRDAGPGYPATIDYLRYAADGDWPASRRGHSIQLTSVSEFRDNDIGSSWRLSSQPGGDPGGTGAPVVHFVRGDATFDSSLDISDPIFTLEHLFLGGQAPVCLDAADADDNGLLEITDPIFSLEYQFVGGAPPPPPFPDAGPDPTTADDALDCRGISG